MNFIVFDDDLLNVDKISYVAICEDMPKTLSIQFDCDEVQLTVDYPSEEVAESKRRELISLILGTNGPPVR